MNEVQLPQQRIAVNPSIHETYSHPYADPAVVDYHSEIRGQSHPQKRLQLVTHPATERHPDDRLELWGGSSQMGGAFQGPVGTELLDHFAANPHPASLRRPDTMTYKNANSRLGHNSQREMHAQPNASPHATGTYNFDARDVIHAVPASTSSNNDMYYFTAGTDTPHRVYAQRMPPTSGPHF